MRQRAGPTDRARVSARAATSARSTAVAPEAVTGTGARLAMRKAVAQPRREHSSSDQTNAAASPTIQATGIRPIVAPTVPSAIGTIQSAWARDSAARCRARRCGGTGARATADPPARPPQGAQVTHAGQGAADRREPDQDRERLEAGASGSERAAGVIERIAPAPEHEGRHQHRDGDQLDAQARVETIEPPPPPACDAAREMRARGSDRCRSWSNGV